MVQPDEVGDPGGVGVAGHDDVVADAVVVEVRQRAVAVSLIAIPSIIVERVGIAISSRLIDARKDGLGTDQTPCGTTVCRLSELVVEPVFLSAAHHTSTGIIADIMNVVGVPVQISNGTIVLTSIKHDQVKQTANAETSPDTKVIVHLNLTNGHPLKVSSDGVHLSLIDRNASIADE